jgi:hypothetical protein
MNLGSKDVTGMDVSSVDGCGCARPPAAPVKFDGRSGAR